jgi:hypothetical protein
MAKQIQIAKSWGQGQIENAGRYILCGSDYSAPRFITVVNVGNTNKVFALDGTEVRLDDTMRHFGPLPSIERSLSAKARHAAEAVPQAS